MAIKFPKLIMKNWLEGGTGVSNFDPKDEHIYIKAIEEYGDPSLVLISKPIGDYHLKGDHSLHHLSNGECLGEFWDIYFRLKEEYKKNEDDKKEL